MTNMTTTTAKMIMMTFAISCFYHIDNLTIVS